jgi:hypothetical protein
MSLNKVKIANDALNAGLIQAGVKVIDVKQILKQMSDIRFLNFVLQSAAG